MCVCVCVCVTKLKFQSFNLHNLKIQIPNSKFQVPNLKFQIPKIKSFSKELHKSIKVFSLKMKKKKNQIRRKSRISKIVGPQIHYYLKSNPKF